MRRHRPFTIDAIIRLPDHLHILWTPPDDDAEYSTPWRKIKESFTRAYLDAGGTNGTTTDGQNRKAMRGVWQPRFWEHAIRDDLDFRRHEDYIHCNPVKHGLASCPHAWPWSSFASWMRMGVYDANWCCECDARAPIAPDFPDIPHVAGEAVTGR